MASERRTADACRPPLWRRQFGKAHMSEAFKDMSVIVSSKDIRSRAADWVLEKHASGAWTDEQQTALDAWLQQSPAHLIAYWRLDDAWGRTNRLAALKTPVIGMQNTAGRSRSHFYSVVA